jgi:hypothetical protein
MLDELNPNGCGSMNGIPDLNNFLQLKVLWVSGGKSSKELTYSGPLVALEELHFDGCSRLIAISDLINFFSIEEALFQGL